ncbi:MAG: hypothetical protein HQM14_00710 [SAR324 cluster bacterium]|nr:hypothetical protein [SAR324 cluster bacterium]
MYASTKKQPSTGVIVILITLVIGILIGGYFLYASWKAQQESSLAISLDTSPEANAPSTAQISSEEVADRLSEALQAQEILQSQNEVLSTSLEKMQIHQDQFDQVKLGRDVLLDFTNRFFKYEVVLNQSSFFHFFSQLVLDYIENRAISVKGMKVSDPLFRKLHNEFVGWVLAQEDEKIQALADFVGFYLIERLYQMPLTLMASGLSTEIEVIDFDAPVFVENVDIAPIRDERGELKMNKSVHLDNYTSAQQFFYRRGPKFSTKVMFFLQAYLAFEGY